MLHLYQLVYRKQIDRAGRREHFWHSPDATFKRVPDRTPPNFVRTTLVLGEAIFLIFHRADISLCVLSEHLLFKLT